MRKVLVLGAGLVARPLVRYLLDETGAEVTVASRTVDKATQLIEGNDKGSPISFDISEGKGLGPLVSGHDVVISLLPYVHHPAVARACLAEGKHLITTSYVSKAMGELDAQARDAGLLFLNEIGLDPGIDHMEAMSLISEIKAIGGSVEEFISYCGGLPSPVHNDNPWGYKFSWSPRGVVMASKNDARFRRAGRVVEVPGRDLFGTYEMVPIEGIGELEGYPNRDSVPYADIYGIPDVRTVLRGTLRNRGWCDTWKGLHDIGILEETPIISRTYLQLMEELAPGDGDIKRRAIDRIRTRDDQRVIANWDWLGLFSNAPIKTAKTRMDALSDLLLEKLTYGPGEQDMIVLQHRFLINGPEGKRNVTSTLVDHGVPYGDSAMSRTVGLPAAIAAEMLLKGDLKGIHGVRVPTLPEIYGPVLERLSGMGLRFKRSWS